MICLNTNISVRNNQEISQSILDVAYSLGGRLPATYDIVDGIKVFSGSTITFLQEIVRRHLFHNDVHPSHAFLSKKLNITTRTVQRVQKELISAGLLHVESGKVKHEVNVYKIGDLLHSDQMIYMLRDVIPCLRFVIRKIKGLSTLEEMTLKLKGYLGLNTVQKQNVGRINKVLKDSNTNTSIYIDTSKTENQSHEKKQTEIRNYSVHGWLPPKIFENVKALMRMDPFMSEDEARKISKYGEMNRLNKERLLMAIQNNPTPQELVEKHMRVIEERKSLNENINRAKKTASGMVSKFMDIVLNGSVGKFL